MRINGAIFAWIQPGRINPSGLRNYIHFTYLNIIVQFFFLTGYVLKVQKKANFLLLVIEMISSYDAAHMTIWAAKFYEDINIIFMTKIYDVIS